MGAPGMRVLSSDPDRVAQLSTGFYARSTLSLLSLHLVDNIGLCADGHPYVQKHNARYQLRVVLNA